MSNLEIIDHKGRFFVDSRDVAEMLGKRHSDLLESIDGYVKYLENGSFRSDEFFILSKYSIVENSRLYPCYLLTRKGCDMVANKMTGEKGVLFTAAYVTKFEEMEKQLQPKLPQTYLEALEALVASEKEKQILLPKAEYFDALVERNLLTNFRDTAKELKVKEGFFINWLLDQGYIYRDASKKLKPYAQYVDKLFEIKEWERSKKAGTQTMITPRGRETFRLLLTQTRDLVNIG